MAKLNAKQQKFVQEYLLDLNATQAAIRAGYSAKTAEATASRLLRNVKVKAAIDEVMKEREEKYKVTADKVIQQLAKIAFADIKDVVEWREREVIVKRGKSEDEPPIIDRVLTIEVKPSSEVDGTILSEISETISNQGRKVTVKMNDRMKALELLGRHLKLFVDRQEITGKDGEPIEISARDQLLSRIASLASRARKDQDTG